MPTAQKEVLQKFTGQSVSPLDLVVTTLAAAQVQGKLRLPETKGPSNPQNFLWPKKEMWAKRQKE